MDLTVLFAGEWATVFLAVRESGRSGPLDVLFLFSCNWQNPLCLTVASLIILSLGGGLAELHLAGDL